MRNYFCKQNKLKLVSAGTVLQTVSAEGFKGKKCVQNKDNSETNNIYFNISYDAIIMFWTKRAISVYNGF